jgi:hypothetical protein
LSYLLQIEYSPLNDMQKVKAGKGRSDFPGGHRFACIESDYAIRTDARITSTTSLTTGMSDTFLYAKEDARNLMVQLSPGVRSAFKKLADLMALSGHFDSAVSEVVQRWASNQPMSVHDVLIGLPMIFEQAMTAGDRGFSQQLGEAWGDIATQMVEEGFSVAKRRTPAVRF